MKDNDKLLPVLSELTEIERDIILKVLSRNDSFERHAHLNAKKFLYQVKLIHLESGNESATKGIKNKCLCCPYYFGFFERPKICSNCKSKICLKCQNDNLMCLICIKYKEYILKTGKWLQQKPLTAAQEIKKILDDLPPKIDETDQSSNLISKSKTKDLMPIIVSDKIKAKKLKGLAKPTSINLRPIKLWKNLQKNVLIKKVDPIVTHRVIQKIANIFMNIFYSKITSNIEINVIKCEIQSQISNYDFFIKINLLQEEDKGKKLSIPIGKTSFSKISQRCIEFDQSFRYLLPRSKVFKSTLIVSLWQKALISINLSEITINIEHNLLNKGPMWFPFFNVD